MTFADGNRFLRLPAPQPKKSMQNADRRDIPATVRAKANEI
jgi:hypothetical protein